MTAETIPTRLRVLRDPDEVNEVRCYTADEVAELIGMSPGFVREQARKGYLKYVRYGTKWRFRHPSVVEWQKSLED